MWPFNRSRRNQQKLIATFGQNRPYTKDIVELEDSPFKLMFIVDDVKRGHQHYDKVLKPISKPVGRGFSDAQFDFRVGKFTGKALPFAVNEGLGLRVKGQLHAVKSHAIPEVDKHYKNGVEFARVKTNVMVVDRHNVTMPIGSEAFVRELPPGMLLTSSTCRTYIGSEPQTCLIEAYMYVAMRVFWDDEDFKAFPRPRPEFPKQELLWLPKYYNYPIERNRCPPVIPK